MNTRTVVVTGASSGIGRATAELLSSRGHRVIAGARRVDALRDLHETTGCEWHALDVTDDDSVREFCDSLESCEVLVNNAGGALGLDRIEAADLANYTRMWETNVLGVVRMTRALLPRLEASGDGHVVTVTSTAAHETYAGGGGYTAAKHAARALTRTLRLELLGRPVRVTDVAPGMVETDFSVVRLGDAERAAAVYAGLTPLVAADIAEIIAFAIERPSHVNIDEIVVRPRDQANSRDVHRRS